MKIIKGRPPIFEEIVAALPGAAEPGVLFCWGDTIFTMGSLTIEPELVVHEAVHCERQGSDLVGWWRRYLEDTQFRLDEETPAHVAEFKKLCELRRPHWVSQRAMRRTFAAHIGSKLAAPLYGNLISPTKAKELLLAA